MSDRTWNPIDARLYEEDWSQGAIIVAACLIARCPNQYGVFDTPIGFIKMFFKGAYTTLEIDGFMCEWEQSGFIKFYDDRRVCWICKKWKRDKYNGISTNQVGAVRYLAEHYPDVVQDFVTMYGLSTNLVPTKTPKPPTSDSDTESEPEKKEQELPAVAAEPIKPPAKKKGTPIEDRVMKNPPGKLVQQWFRRYLKVHDVKWSGDIARMGGQAKTLLRDHSEDDLLIAMAYLFDKPKGQYNPHTWDFYVRKISDHIVEAREAGYST